MATVTLRPSSAGTTTQLTPTGAANNWDCVDETPSDDDTTYVSTDDVEGRDTYTIPNPSDSGTINSVTVHAVCRRTHATGSAIDVVRPILYTYGSVYWQEYSTPSNSYTDYTYQTLTNPDTLGAWTWAEINALEIGVSLYENRVGNELRCTQVWVVVDYTPAAFIPQVIMIV